MNEKQWRIERACPDDAARIAYAFEETYAGVDYPFKHIFFEPNQVRALIEDAKTLTYVVLCGDDVAGTGSVVFDTSGSRAEVGRACIRPQYRGMHVNGSSAFGDLIRRRTSDAKTHGASVIYSCGVTGHPKSQVTLSKAGFQPVGVELGKYPDIFGRGQRESTVIMLYKEGDFGLGKDVFVPKDVESVVAHGVEMLGLDRSIARGRGGSYRVDIAYATDPDLSRHGKFTVLPGKSMRVGDACGLIERISEDERLVYSQVEIATTGPMTAAAYNALSCKGFAVSGFAPNWSHKDGCAYDVMLMERCREPVALDRLETICEVDGLLGKVIGHGFV